MLMLKYISTTQDNCQKCGRTHAIALLTSIVVVVGSIVEFNVPLDTV